MDIYDQASQQEELMRDVAIASALKQKFKLKPVGQCYNCLESLSNEGEFCDADCRDDWQRRQRNR